MIPIARPGVTEAEIAAAVAAMRSGWISQGPRSAEFEAAVAKRIGVDHARAVNSCTNAILLTLLALGVQEGDEIIVPAFTCAAALNPIEILRAVPVPVDIELTSFGLQRRDLEKATTARTRGVLLAHLFGFATNVEPIAAHCRENALWLIEDIALGFGALMSGRSVGSFGDAAVLSFHPRKLITTGEGGMVVTNRADIAESVGALRNYGAERPAWERHTQRLFELPHYSHAGLNCKLTDIQAAIGIEQVKRMDEMIAARAAIAARYDEAFKALSWATPVKPLPETIPSWQSYVLLISDAAPTPVNDGASVRERLLEHLYSRGVASVQGAQAMELVDYYRARYPGWSERFPKALRADRTSLCLPIFPSLASVEQDRVIEAVLEFQP